jgi:hypothetical protein
MPSQLQGAPLHPAAAAAAAAAPWRAPALAVSTLIEKLVGGKLGILQHMHSCLGTPAKLNLRASSTLRQEPTVAPLPSTAVNVSPLQCMPLC